MPKKHVETLTFLMARVRILQRAFRREERLLQRRVGNRQPTLADGLPAITFLNVYLANVHVLIEAWDRYLFYDDDVYKLLSAGYRDRIKKFRNAVFHAGPFNEERLVAVYAEHQEVAHWADDLLDAVSRFVKRELAARRLTKLRAV